MANNKLHIGIEYDNDTKTINLNYKGVRFTIYHPIKYILIDQFGQLSIKNNEKPGNFSKPILQFIKVLTNTTGACSIIEEC